MSETAIVKVSQERFLKLDKEFVELTREEARDQKSRFQRALQASAILVETYEMFQKMPSGEIFRAGGKEFPTWSKWVAVRCPDQEGYSPKGYSRAHCYTLRDIGLHLVSAIGLQSARQLPSLEHAKALTALAKVKGKVSAPLLEMAKEKSSKDVWGQVKAIIYQGNDSHDEGIKDVLAIECGKKQLKGIEAKIKALRPAMGNVSDAEVIEMALADCQKTVNAQEAERVEEIAGVSVDQKLAWTLARLLVDWAFKTGEVGEEFVTRVAHAILDPAKEIKKYGGKNEAAAEEDQA